MAALVAEFLRLVGSRANALAEESAKKENYRITSDYVLAAIEVFIHYQDDSFEATVTYMHSPCMSKALGKEEYLAVLQEQQGTHEVERQVRPLDDATCCSCRLTAYYCPDPVVF